MRILITGGLGFIGSNLATRLSKQAHHITILDNLNPLYGGNKFNLHDANLDNIDLIIGDARDKELILRLVKDIDVVFHFAAQVSYIDSLNIPFEDVEVNSVSTLILLESIKKLNQKTKIIFSSSRLVYGRILQTPVAENHITAPLSLYGIHKMVSEKYLEIYQRNYGIPYVIIRITNPFGIKQQMKHNKYSIVGWFMRMAMEDKVIKIFGSGEQKRDYIYIESLIDAFNKVMLNNECENKIYNVGAGYSIKFKEMVNHIVAIVGKGKVEHIEWPTNYESIETGNFEVSLQKLHEDTGWINSCTFEEGIEKTFKYYKRYYEEYF